MNTRKAAVAGQFYEKDPLLLEAQIAGLMPQPAAQTSARPKVLIVPHAGYIYSGAIAARAYCQLETMRDQIRRIVLIGPAHRVYLTGMALPSVDTFTTPLGEIPLDRQSIETISGMPGVCVSDEAHREEHCLEVQLPLLQTMLTQFSLVPVVVGNCEADMVAAVIDKLWGGADTLVVISTDLSHFHAYEEAQEIDLSTCERILAKAVDLSGEQACGASAVNGLMASEHCRTLQVELLAACNSGDSAGGKDRVVGYGAFQLH
jgi:hypothetical protein